MSMNSRFHIFLIRRGGTGANPGMDRERGTSEEVTAGISCWPDVVDVVTGASQLLVVTLPPGTDCITGVKESAVIPGMTNGRPAGK